MTRLGRFVLGIGGALVVGLAPFSHGFADGPDAASVSIGRDPGPLRPAGYSLALNSTQAKSIPGRNAGLDGAWRDALRVDGKFKYDSVSLQFQSNFVDLSRLGGRKGAESFFVSNNTSSWEDNSVADTAINLGLWNDRVRFTSRRAWSSYSASESYLQSLSRDSDQGRKRRFLAAKGAKEGNAALHRVDATVWKTGDASLAAFAQHSEVDRFFESVELSDRKHSGPSDNRHPFVTPNREAVRLGVTAGLGPVHLTLHRETAHKVEGADGERELRRGASVWVDLTDLRYRAGEAFQGGLWAWAPDSVWVSLTEGRIQAPGDRADPDDTTADISFGASWDWSGGYASAGVWRFLYDSRGAWVDDDDWTGDGADVAFGFYGREWSVDASFSLSRSDNLAPVSRSADYGYDGTLSLTLRPEALPDFSGSLSLGRYGTDYIAYAETSRTDTWTLGLTADFSKYLVDPKATDQPRLELGYRFEGDHTRDGFTGESGRAAHTVAALLQLRL